MKKRVNLIIKNVLTKSAFFAFVFVAFYGTVNAQNRTSSNCTIRADENIFLKTITYNEICTPAQFLSFSGSNTGNSFMQSVMNYPTQWANSFSNYFYPQTNNAQSQINYAQNVPNFSQTYQPQVYSQPYFVDNSYYNNNYYNTPNSQNFYGGSFFNNPSYYQTTNTYTPSLSEYYEQEYVEYADYGNNYGYENNGYEGDVYFEESNQPTNCYSYDNGGEIICN